MSYISFQFMYYVTGLMSVSISQTQDLYCKIVVYCEIRLPRLCFYTTYFLNWRRRMANWKWHGWSCSLLSTNGYLPDCLFELM